MSDQCQQCGKPKHECKLDFRGFCLLHNHIGEAYEFCHGHADEQPQPSRSQLRREALQKGETMPTFDEQQRAEASDLTAEELADLLHELTTMEYDNNTEWLAVQLTKPESDEIVLGLRVLRVRRHPRCQQIRFGSYGGFEFSIRPPTMDGHDAESWAFARWMELGAAERLLGYGGGE